MPTLYHPIIYKTISYLKHAQLQDLQNSVDHWRGRISSFSRELERIDDSMKDQLEKILGEVDGWRDDLAIRIRLLYLLQS